MKPGSLDPTQTVEERLRRAGWRMMVLAHAIEQSETAAEFRMHGFWRVPHHFQAAASLGSFRGETRDDDMTGRGLR